MAADSAADSAAVDSVAAAWEKDSGVADPEAVAAEGAASVARETGLEAGERAEETAEEDRRLETTSWYCIDSSV